MSNKERLSDDQVPEISQLLQTHIIVDAAATLGVAVATLRRFMRKHGIAARTRTKVTNIDSALQSYQAGATLTALAAEHGVHPTTLRKALIGAGATIRKEWCRSSAGPVSPEHKQEMARAYTAGETIPQIAQRLQCSSATVHKQLTAAGVERRSMGPKRKHHDKRARQYKLDDSASVLSSDRCAICGATAGSDRNMGRATLCVDHSHVLGRVRGALCHRCNLGIAYFADSPTILQAAAQHVGMVDAPPSAPRALSDGLLQLLRRQTIDRLVVLQPHMWNVQSLLDKGYTTSQARWALHSYLSTMEAQAAVLPEEEHRYREKQGPHLLYLNARSLDIDLQLQDDEAAELYDEVHIQGTAGGPAVHHVGLRDGKQLVAAMRFVMPSTCRSRHQGLLLQRFASARGTRIRGGASRLLRAVTRRQLTPVVSFSDNRYTNGDLYRALGFVCVEHLAPDYMYYRDGQLVNKSRLQKRQLLRHGGDPGATEYELADDQGWLRLFDAGKKTWYLPAERLA